MVFSYERNVAVEDAEVTLVDRPGLWFTDRFGHFVIPVVEPGDVVLRVRHPGYAPVHDTLRLAPGVTYHADVRMTVRPIELEAVEVTVRPRYASRRMEMVYRRMDRNNFGHFRTEPDFQARGHPSVKDMLWGVHFRSISWRGACQPTVYLDGARADLLDLRWVSTRDVEVLEIYNSTAGIPGQYRGPGTFCAVLIWTKG
jgi:hypothetical protein